MQRPRTWPGRFAVTGAVIGLLLAGGIAWLTGRIPILPGPDGVLWNSTDEDAEVWLERADKAIALADNRRAFVCLQMAARAASGRKTKYEVALSMGRFLVAQAASQRPHVFIPMARQYLEAALDMADTPRQKVAASRSLMQAYRIRKDMPAMRKAGAIAMRSARGDAERGMLLLMQIDACLEFGTSTEMSGLLKEAAEVFENLPHRREELEARKAAVRQQFVLRDDWFEDYAREKGPAAAELRRMRLLDEAMDLYRLAAKGIGESERLAEQTLDLAHMCRKMKRTEEADRLLQAFLESEFAGRLDEALLLSIGIALDRGLTVDASRGIQTYLQRHGSTVDGIEAGLGLIRVFENVDQDEKAMNVVELFEQYAPAGRVDPRFQAKGALLAGRLALFDRAEAYVNTIMTRNAPIELIADTVESYARICLERGEPARVKRLMTRCLAQFPRYSVLDDLYFRLFDIERGLGSLSGAVVLTGLAAAQRNPDNERAVEAIVSAAGVVETTGELSVAGELYRKACMLNVDDGNGERERRAGGDKALVGRARCLLAKGETVKADHLLREATWLGGTGDTGCEASLLWSRIAARRGQILEAQRRLEDAKPRTATPGTSAILETEKQLLVLAADPSAGAVDNVLAAIQCLDAETGRDHVRSAFASVFDTLAANADVDSMQKALQAATSSPFAEHLPIRLYAWLTGQAILDNRGMAEFAEWIKGESGALLTGTHPEAGRVTDAMQAGATAVESLRTDLAKLL